MGYLVEVCGGEGGAAGAGIEGGGGEGERGGEGEEGEGHGGGEMHCWGFWGVIGSGKVVWWWMDILVL